MLIDFYEKYCLPHLTTWVCGQGVIGRQRAKIVPQASGRVLEIGMGAGLNIPFYQPEKMTLLWGLEPSAEMRKKAAAPAAAAPFEVRLLASPGEEIPLDSSSVDTVVLTYTLCTIPDWEKALQEMRRVLQPQGQLLFCEHGRAPEESVRRWQERLNPLWRMFAGGCNLNRPVPSLLETAGFRITRLDTHYLPASPRFAGFNYLGTARPR